MRYVQQNGLMKFEEYPYTSQVKFERRLFHSTDFLSSDKYWPGLKDYMLEGSRLMRSSHWPGCSRSVIIY